MTANFTTDVILDKRYPRKKKATEKDDIFPVKLRVSIDGQSRWYGLKYYMTQKGFDSVINVRAKGANKDIRDALLKEEKRARDLLKAMKHPNFETFRSLYLHKNPINGTGNVRYYFDKYIEECRKEGRVGTATSYNDAKQSIDRMMGLEGLNFRTITVSWLKEYQRKMEESGKKASTIGVYLRSLRALYNRAIYDGVVAEQHYPFGRRKYQIPATLGRKRPLSRDAIKRIAQYQGDPALMYYRDFFLLSYFMGGINFADMLILRWDEIKDDVLVHQREKTKRTRQNAQQSRVKMIGKIKELIDAHGNPDGEYIFAIVSAGDDPTEKRRKIQLFTKSCNDGLKRLAKQIDLPTDISTIWARHSAASHGVASGAPLAVISQTLGHANLSTTSRYVSALTEDVDAYLDYLQSDD